MVTVQITLVQHVVQKSQHLPTPSNRLPFLTLERTIYKTEGRLPSKDAKVQKCFGPKEPNVGTETKATNICSIMFGDSYERR